MRPFGTGLHFHTFSISFLIQSHQVFFGHPLCLIPSTSHFIQHLTQSFHSTCPNHLNLLFLIIKPTGSNPFNPINSAEPVNFHCSHLLHRYLHSCSTTGGGFVTAHLNRWRHITMVSVSISCTTTAVNASFSKRSFQVRFTAPKEPLAAGGMRLLQFRSGLEVGISLVVLRPC